MERKECSGENSFTALVSSKRLISLVRKRNGFADSENRGKERTVKIYI